MKGGKKIKVAVYKFSSCDGCQLQFLNMEDELLLLIDRIEFAYFLEASREVKPGPYDVAFVEGSVSTPHEEELIKEVRKQAKIVVAIGACATAGGIQALRNFGKLEEFKKLVYPNPEWIDALEHARPISDFIKVDYELRGCPVSKERLLSFVKQLLAGRRPVLKRESVCTECKRKGNVCVVVSKGIPCLGPVTQEGCGALCPSFGRGCYGCFGPMIDPKPEALAKRFEELGFSRRDIALQFKTFTGWSEPFRKVVIRYGGK